MLMKSSVPNLAEAEQPLANTPGQEKRADQTTKQLTRRLRGVRLVFPQLIPVKPD